MMRRKMGYDKNRLRGVSHGKSRDGDELDSDDISQIVRKRPPRSKSLRKEQQELDLESDDDDHHVKRRGRKSKSIRFEDDEDEFDRQDSGDKDTPPTRSRSRKGRSRVAFGDDPTAKPSSLKISGLDRVASEPRSRSRGSNKSRPRSTGWVRSDKSHSRSQNRVHPEPKFGIGGQGTDSRRQAFEAKFDKYRANKRTKEMIEKRATLLE